MSSGLSPAVLETPATVMDWADAQRELIQGKKITRQSWANGDTVFLYAGVLHIQKGDDKTLHRLIVSDGDMFGEDWTVVGADA